MRAFRVSTVFVRCKFSAMTSWKRQLCAFRWVSCSLPCEHLQTPRWPRDQASARDASFGRSDVTIPQKLTPRRPMTFVPLLWILSVFLCRGSKDLCGPSARYCIRAWNTLSALPSPAQPNVLGHTELAFFNRLMPFTVRTYGTQKYVHFQIIYISI
jgi:hypothetical protein